MRLTPSFRMISLVMGMTISAIGPLAAQTASTTQQTTSPSPYQTANEALSGGATTAKTGSVGDTMGDAQSRQMDKRFLNQVMEASLLNVAMGKLAAEKGSSDSVKQYGLKMVSDHQRAIAIFKRVAAKDGVTLPDSMDAKHQERLDKLAKLSGPEFDRAYVKDQLKAHQRMVSYFQSEADNGTEAAAQKLATNMLPAVAHHLEDTKELNKSLNTLASTR